MTQQNEETTEWSRYIPDFSFMLDNNNVGDDVARQFSTGTEIGLRETGQAWLWGGQ